jgi:hypothetical protein
VAEQPAPEAAELQALVRTMRDAAERAAEFIRGHAARLGELTWDTKSPPTS